MQPAPPGASTCANCGGVLEETPGGGLGCMSCLLRAGIGSEKDVGEDSTPDTFEDGGRFGIYEIDRREDGSLYELGRGAMGVTYRATDTSLQRKVALKIIKIDIAARSADARERFVREARAAAALRHENIATIHQFGMRQETAQYFYVMELIEGETLDERVHRAGPLDARSTIQIAQQVTSALAAAEKHGLVHRDLKPANLMLVSTDGETADVKSNKKLLVKIIDFGLAKAIHSQTDPKSLTHDKFVGTPAFASPEQFEHCALDVRSDIYSLGETLWFSLTGKTPFAGHSVEEIHRAQRSNALPIEQLKAAHVPSRLRSLLESMLAFEPASRPGTHELATCLQRCAPEARHVRRMRVALAAAALLILGVSASFMFFSLRTQNSRSNLEAPEKSIAVLPFENLSRDPDNAYLADGIQDEILTRLSKISDLKVISRTSTQTYKNAPRNLREIAQQLGVSSILEGRVQKSADQVRVTVQLINAVTDSHLWAESYDRKFSDIFQVESDVAQKIATALEAKLTGREKSDIASVGTQNSQAYDAYLRARALYREFTHDSVQRTVQALEEAVRLDPNFAAAWALLARMQTFAYFVRFDRTEMRRIAARKAVETAIRLQPDLAEAQMARGFYEYWVMDDYDAARRTFEQVQSRWPNNADILEPLGLIAFRQGRWNEAREYFDAAIALNPRDHFLRWNAVYARAHVRDFPAALRAIDQALAVWPDDTTLIASKAEIYQALGQLDQADALLSRLHPKEGDFSDVVEAICDQAMLRRDPAAAITLLRTSIKPPNSAPPLEQAHYNLHLGELEGLSGNGNEAWTSFTQAREALEKELQQQPQDGTLAYMLARTLAGLGEREGALRWADRAVELSPSSHDARSGPGVEEMRARIQARFGDGDHAIPTLKHLLEIPYAGALTPALLRLHPDFDPLRGDPRFQELCKDEQPLSSAPMQITEKSIAVLPFENLSEERANAYFAQGIQNEILTKLATVRDLKVISRTSTAKYQSKPDNLKTIAQELGVSTILEGAVQKAGDKVRVTVQLIDARTDAHLWAKSYDREFKDVLSVESEVAEQIAESLQAKLSPTEKERLDRRPTTDSDAYLLYVQAHDYANRLDRPRDNSLKAEKLFEQAIKLDPTFALAFAGLSEVESWIYHSNEPTAARREKARVNANESLRLQPDLPEGHLALGFSYYYGDRNYERALTEFEIAKRDLPNQAQAYLAIGAIQRRQGKWAQSTANLEKSASLDPKNAFVIQNLALSYMYQRDFKTADKIFDRVIVGSPQSFVPRVMKADLSIIWNGDVGSAENQLASIPPGFDPEGLVTSARVSVLTLQRRFAAALHVLQQFRGKILNDRSFALCPKALLEGRLYLYQDDKMNAQAALERARPVAEQLVREGPDDPFRRAQLGAVLAGLSRKEDAINEGRKAVELLPESEDAVDGPQATAALAEIYVWVGEHDEAFRLLDHLLTVPNGLTVPLLKLDPVWDSLRSDPRFQKLCAEKP
jgi:TolB-like protein/Tfp pilus assembly protein PilF